MIDMSKKIYVLGWSYWDGSGRGVLRAYNNQEAAIVDLDLLNEFSSEKEVKIYEVDLL